MQLFDLSLVRAAFLATREHIDHPVDSLPLPCADLVWVKLTLRSDLLRRLVATQRFQRKLGLKLVCKISTLRHFRIPS